jgi:type III secretory pathway component EscR
MNLKYEVMTNRKKLSIIISLLFAGSFLLYASFVAIDAVDIAIFSALGFAIVYPFSKKSNSCTLDVINSNDHEEKN